MKKKKNAVKSKVKTPTTTKSSPNEKLVNQCQVGEQEQTEGVALPTATVTVHGNSSTKQGTATKKKVRAFFDTGSQCSFIHPELVEELDLKMSKRKELSITAFGGNVQTINCTTVLVKVSMGDGPIYRIPLIVTDKVNTRLVVPGLLETADRLSSQGVKLADRFDSDIIDQVKIMIGADHFGRFVTGLRRKHRVNLFTSQGGHMIHGKVQGTSPSDKNVSYHNNQLFVVARVTMSENEYLTNDVSHQND